MTYKEDGMFENSVGWSNYVKKGDKKWATHFSCEQ